MSATKCPSRKLKGLSFEISDLILIQDRAQANDFRVGTSPLSQWMMWRNASAVFLRSSCGRSRRYRSAAQAIEALVRKERLALTDIKATGWPPF